jgi:hypothetical protein
VFSKLSLATAVAVGAALVVAPTASADESNGLDVALVRGASIATRNGVWIGLFNRTFSFHVDVTDVGDQDDDGLSVFVSVPFTISGYQGDRWECWDVEGGARCEISDVVVPGETWPRLTIEGSGRHIDDTIDVYASSRLGDAHAGVPFIVG